MTVLAAWRNLEGMEGFRQDLWQRICHNRIRVPSLAIYSATNRSLGCVRNPAPVS